MKKCKHCNTPNPDAANFCGYCGSKFEPTTKDGSGSDLIVDSTDMPGQNDNMPAKKLLLFFICDVSSSMKGAKIGALNDAIEEVLPMLSGISSSYNNYIEVEIAVLQFSSGAQWTCPKPVAARGFEWRPLTVSGGADFGEACKELAKKLTHKEGGFMYSPTSSIPPAFILLSDGQPTDSYEAPLQKLKENKWFQVGIKSAIAIGDDADKVMLRKFAPELVFTVHDVTSCLRSVVFGHIDYYCEKYFDELCRELDARKRRK